MLRSIASLKMLFSQEAERGFLIRMVKMPQRNSTPIKSSAENLINNWGVAELGGKHETHRQPIRESARN